MRPVYPGTFSIKWLNIGTIGATEAGSDGALGVTERKFQTIKSLANVVHWQLPSVVSAVRVRFILTTNNADVDIDIWTGNLERLLSRYASEDCSLQRRATLDVICGNQDVQGISKKFADTCNIINDSFENGVDKANPGTDHIITIHFDMKGDDLLVFHGYGTFNEDCQIEVTGYS